MKESVEIRMPVPDERRDRLAAELIDVPLTGYLFDGDDVRIYFDDEVWSEKVQVDVKQALVRAGLPSEWHEERIEEINWNEAWERTIQPMRVGPFFIRPSWHVIEARLGEDLDLVIDPKMSFGTGHHESTRLALRHLVRYRSRLTSVLDVGTGTGILAIAAVRLGARKAIGVDIDPWSLSNARENVLRNGVGARVDVRLGRIDDVVEDGFSLVVANINRTVLIAELSAYRNRCSDRGAVVVSGIERRDRELMLGALSQAGLALDGELTEGAWWSAAAVPIE